jgi:hypothetical protein
MFGLPTTWLIGGIVVSVALFFGVVQVRHMAKLEAVRSEGVAIGKGESSAAALKAAEKGAEAERAAEAETPVTLDRAAIIALCKRSASCKERHTLQ